MSFDKKDYLSRLQTLLVFLILYGTVKTMLAYCGEIVKNSIVAYSIMKVIAGSLESAN